jgi:DNA-binding GntR family transcriptional regulator
MADLLDGRQVQRHAPIRQQVASILRDAIVELRLPPGQLLVERQLCEMTSASRPSVREALRQLEAEGLVESQNGRGTVVSIASPELARNVYGVRAELEGFAAQLFAENATDDERQNLRVAVREVSAAVERGDKNSAILAAKNNVYDVLFVGSGNPILYQLLGTLQRRVTQLRALTLAQPGRPKQSAKEIEDILAAIDNHDAAAARAAATFHVNQAAAIVLATFDTAQAPKPATASTSSLAALFQNPLT